VLAVTPQPPWKNDGDGRARTGGLSPDKRALCSSELRPQGIACDAEREDVRASPVHPFSQVARVGFEPTSRAHETREEAAPPPRIVIRRASDWQESNLRSPVPETGGVASLPYSQSKHPRRDSNPQSPD
jgi:hypothetical protein